MCLVKRAYSYGTGGVPPAPKPDQPGIVDFLNQRFADSGYRFPDLLRTIILSTAFTEVIDPPK